MPFLLLPWGWKSVGSEYLTSATFIAMEPAPIGPQTAKTWTESPFILSGVPWPSYWRWACQNDVEAGLDYAQMYYLRAGKWDLRKQSWPWLQPSWEELCLWLELGFKPGCCLAGWRSLVQEQQQQLVVATLPSNKNESGQTRGGLTLSVGFKHGVS